MKLKLADQVYGALRQFVEGGEWPEGTRIPPETELAKNYGVSRPVVREALIRLRMEGLIGSRKGSGNFVIGKNGLESGGYRPIENIADLIQAFEFRFSVECDVAAFAALRRTDEELEQIRVASVVVRNQSNEETFGDADFGFHLALSRASRNAMYETTLSMLRTQIVFGMRLVGEFSQQQAATRSEAIFEEHETIVDAVEARHADKAQLAMGRHLMNSRRRILGFEIASDWQPTLGTGPSIRRGQN
ncbi:MULTISPECIES: FadR/GntR family transcriptional regulator [unclassified Mesorhizobium]|uniref:FadR/GntR family transcriptional regulator n=1 Tax=unclassified Mesorhizobium TaxID=325217 RepID=UPI000FEA9CF9|nr:MULTISPECIES: FadR/GntR family transcriptional regulator [unclassified Mesorhizobium]RWB66488.1 MAG: FadR family transcriptional regulator [Mesorhizobium sp.]RWB90722.1 MAG: FadR family transcriptional regulator [Mesorhizobium sp.]RWC17206.1 MAG: FadR family transcriptional regulator [Mesorhizobium sp.]TGS64181.1 FadR family transcriptional regulator [Mesorhizobium sp. M3A.F.Ca.ET.201.01.1.1]TGS85904.1 FadR family transcriptional regulator [Mesorhizobium sp. M3A.F.Ca.ET.175.01.1.1]